MIPGAKQAGDQSMPPITIILVNGFLGAGKTTLLATAAKRLAGRGRRVGVITNDQAAELVDTFSLRREGLEVAEVAGGCFCCQFDGLMAALDDLLARGARPEVVFAEAVGSCTDLSATVIQPLKDLHADQVRLAPYSVVVDVLRLQKAETLSGEPGFGADVLYIFDQQVLEADLLLLNKTDALAPAEVERLRGLLAVRNPQARILLTAARQGDGIDAWLDAVLAGGASGATLLEVDYDRYADGEAELGWLNARAEVAVAVDTDWQAFARALLLRLRDACAARSAAVAHLKLALSAAGGSIIGSVTAADGDALFRLFGSPSAAAHQAALVVNARVRLAPELLRHEVETTLAALPGATVRILDLAAFRPGRPQPRHHYDHVVG